MANKKPLTTDKKEFTDSETLLIPNAGIVVNEILVTPTELSYLENSQSNLQAQIDLLP
ncbi:hypothetical protein ACNQF7_10125 [Flavobacterium sp. RSP29]|uniref:hypothetical protein n=1 Tax=Flavobacterium sp. RSP29 TaxID=3401731 RepID=UPI003AADC87D